MDDTAITIRKYTDFDEMKADEYRYWQSGPAHERLDAIEEMIETAYALKGWEMEPDVPRKVQANTSHPPLRTMKACSEA